jgi:hypothetical protein
MNRSNYELSICIPARNEEFLSRTIQDILDHRTRKTEIIVFLDGQWANPRIEDHPDVRIIHSSVSIGQRAATNQCVRLSRAKWIMKCDAHCTFDQGFDDKLLNTEGLQDNWTLVPTMRNLHAFDWVCEDGHRRYQGPSGVCAACGKVTTKDTVWQAKPSPNSTAFCFDAEPHFQYHNEWKKKQTGDIVETMSLQGSCFMLTREKYWELDICSEEFGSWGSQGIEVAVKTWLSGGRVVCNRSTYYAHMFRTQGGDFGFPYPQSGQAIDRAKKHAKDLFFGNRWDKQILPLSWLVEKFWPVPGWTQQDLDNIKQYDSKIHPRIDKGIIYYTDNQLSVKLARRVQNQIKKAGLPIVSASLKSMDNMGKNIHLRMKRGSFTMFKQILAALEASTAEIVFFCEHDVLYHPSHFEFTPDRKDKFYYNQNFWKVWPDGFAAHWDANQVSGLCGYREHLLEFYRKRVQEVEKGGFNHSYEPGGRNKSQYEVWNSAYPNIDVRHDNNLTKSHRSPNDFKDKSTCVNWQEGTIETIPGWDNLASLI